MTCPRELDTAQAARLGGEPPEHLRSCADCRDVFSVTSKLAALASRDRELPQPLPSAGQLWWKGEIARRRAARDEAERPIRVAEAIGPAVMLVALLGWIVASFLSSGATVFAVTLALGAVAILAGVVTLRPFLSRS